MSRILVKNLPPSLTPKDFETHFSQRSLVEGPLNITDVKLVHKKDGTFRRFGFIGYKKPSEARKAQEWFNATYFGSCKIQVEVIEDGLKSERPVKRVRTDKDTKPRYGIAEGDKKQGKLVDDPLFKEYMEVMHRSKRNQPVWADSVVAPEPVQTSQLENEQHAKAISPMRDRNNEPISDMDWLKSKMQSGYDPEGKTFYQDEGTEENKHDSPEIVIEPTGEDKARQTILCTARLFLRNLTFSVVNEELEELFIKFGPIEQIHIPLTAEHKGKGVAYVKFKHALHAFEAFQKLDGTVFQGRLLHILPAVDRQSRSEADQKHGVKDKRLEAKKQTIARKNSLWDWGSLYMNSDAIASSIAARFSVSKADILQEGDDHSTSSINPAVKLALAETHIIEETRKFLASQGVHIGAFATETNSSRHGNSPTTLLIKNIPFGTSDNDLRKLFSAHGEIVRLVVPPSGTIAVIDFDDSSSADSAIRHLSYRRVGNSVMYIERAPVAVWESNDDDRKIAGQSRSARPIAITEAPASADTSTASGTTLYVKNLSFNTTTEALVRAFQHLPQFSFAKVATKPDPKKANGKLSMGFGFVGFSGVESAKRAQMSMNGFVLDGHKVVVKFAGRGVDDVVAENKAASIGNRQTTKMLVKNLPFEASKKDVRQLFGAHGQLKSVRVPKRYDSRSRGFAFLEFVSRQEAERVYNALKHTHLLGRHLVLEWAEDESKDIDKLREKVGIGFGEGNALPGRKRKVMMDAKVDTDDE